MPSIKEEEADTTDAVEGEGEEEEWEEMEWQRAMPPPPIRTTNTAT